MTTVVRSNPLNSEGAYANPFKLFIPRELSEDEARVIWGALREHEDIVLADPFALEGVSTVFPGIFYDTDDDHDLYPVARLLNNLELDSLEDSWLELWVPDAYEDQAEALAVDDLTDPRNNI